MPAVMERQRPQTMRIHTGPKPASGRYVLRVVQFEASRSAVQRGYNAVELAVERGGPQTVVWLEVSIEP